MQGTDKSIESTDSVHNLLLVLVQFHFELTDKQSLLEAASRVKDWDRLLQAADWHRLDTLMFKHLGNEPTLPENVCGTLKQRAQIFARRALMLVSLQFRAVAALEEAGIPTLVLKGAPLGTQLYGDMALRRSRDVDLLIETKDIPKAREVLLQMGCRTETMTPYQQAVLEKTDNEMKFFHGGELIELQWGLAAMHAVYPVEPGTLIDQAQEIRVAGRSCKTLSEEENLVYLCFHGTKHYWFRLFWLCDLVAWAQKKDSDWDAILKRADERDMRACLLLGFYLAKRALGCTLPEPLQKALDEQETIPAYGERILKHLLGTQARPYEVPVNNLHTLEVNLWMHPQWSVRLKLLWRYIFEPTLEDTRKLKLPKGLRWLYIPIKPLRLAFQFFRPEDRASNLVMEQKQ